MFKIKLLILLFISVGLNSCTSKNITTNQFSLKYIGGGEDGVIYSNLLKIYLKSLSMLNDNSEYSINTSINHAVNVFITNVNNTSDREMITTEIKAEIKDEDQNCVILNYENSAKQFYVISPNINFTSNTKAIENIKKDNAEILSKELVYFLSKVEKLKCIND